MGQEDYLYPTLYSKIEEKRMYKVMRSSNKKNDALSSEFSYACFGVCMCACNFLLWLSKLNKATQSPRYIAHACMIKMPLWLGQRLCSVR